MQVYLSDDLYAALKARRLPASELLQRAIVAELRRLDLVAAGKHYLRDLVADVGEPSPAERARARAWARQLSVRPRRRAG
jgi:hypothetical protein